MTPEAPPRSTCRLVIGILGGMAVGKSHVSRRVAALGPGRVIDADELAHEALAQLAADGRLAEELGPQYVVDGRPDRPALARDAFADPGLLRRLERLVHPHCVAAIQDGIARHREGRDECPVLVLDVVLLLEVGLDRRCDELWFVEAPGPLREERAKARGLTQAEVARREHFQTPTARKRERADRVIVNGADPEALDRQIRAALAELGVGGQVVMPPPCSPP